MTPFEHEDALLPNIDDNEEEIIYVSKSEIKRDAEALKKLGVELVQLSKNELSKIPLDEDMIYAIELAQKIKKEGYRRQIQYIGKLLRNRDIDPISQALDKLKNRHNQQNAILHKLEKLRDDLIDTGDAEPIIAWNPQADRQQLRQLARTAKKERDTNKPPKSARLIFQYLKDLSESA
ncbi:ribosome biogenesis factor YjgA [Frischella perrara]|uniref:Dual-action ribosomal maturation protein DarP n=1 Tax=Frischella perrara TaxID=1267021 RepID=A0A318MT33_FRIPE|nr:ribosome biogenesis factor YjgA [Frischella perrara]PXY96238.1 ribosome-associated protein [Frischella perrara]